MRYLFNIDVYTPGLVKNLRFFKKRLRFFRFLGFLGFNVRTVARGTLDTGIDCGSIYYQGAATLAHQAYSNSPRSLIPVVQIARVSPIIIVQRKILGTGN